MKSENRANLGLDWIFRDLWNLGGIVDCSVLVHLPFGFGTGGGSAFVKDHCLFESDDFAGGGVDIDRRAGGFPVAGGGGSAWTASPRFSFLARNKEEPLLVVPFAQLPGKLWFTQNLNSIKLNSSLLPICFFFPNYYYIKKKKKKKKKLMGKLHNHACVAPSN